MHNMFARGPLTAQPDPMGKWGYDRQNNCIVRMKEPGKTTIGDIRIKYYITSNSMENNNRPVELVGVDNDDNALNLHQRVSKETYLNFESFIKKYLR